MNTTQFSRRQLLQSAACGFGGLALSGMVAGMVRGASPLAVRAPHFAPRAKRIIFLFMAGGVSHVDSFDYKQKLFDEDGKMVRFDDARTLAKTRKIVEHRVCLLYTSPSPRDKRQSRMPSSA